MNVRQLNEKEPLKIETIYIIEEDLPTPPTPFHKVPVENTFSEYPVLTTQVLTDGNIIREEEVSKRIAGYKFGIDYYPADILKTKYVFLKDYSYIVTFITTNEMRVMEI